MTRFRVSKRSMLKLMDFESATEFSWPVAQGYEVQGQTDHGDGTIHAHGGYRYSGTKPLTDSNLFLSFARCSPAPKKIVAWVEKYGLLTRSYENELGDPLPISEFVAEVHTAYRALTLYQAIRSRDAEALRGRITFRSMEKDLKERGLEPPIPHKPSDFAQIKVDGNPIPYYAHVGKDLSYAQAVKDLPDKKVFFAAVYGLQHLSNDKLDGLRFRLAENFEHPRPLSMTHMPMPKWAIPDLKSALWLQFSLLVSDAHPLKSCSECGTLFPVFNDKQDTCTAG